MYNIKSFIACKILLGSQVKKDEMDEKCISHGRDEKC